MDLQTVIVSSLSQTEKHKEMILLMHGILKKNGTNEFIKKNRVIEGENKSWLPEAEEGINWETRIDIITLLYVK